MPRKLVFPNPLKSITAQRRGRPTPMTWDERCRRADEMYAEYMKRDATRLTDPTGNWKRLIDGQRIPPPGVLEEMGREVERQWAAEEAAERANPELAAKLSVLRGAVDTSTAILNWVTQIINSVNPATPRNTSERRAVEQMKLLHVELTAILAAVERCVARDILSVRSEYGLC